LKASDISRNSTQRRRDAKREKFILLRVFGASGKLD
jgi:hypothetical protein